MQKEPPRNYARYLPSKKFVLTLGICAGTLLLVLLVTSRIGTKTLFNTDLSNGGLISDAGTVDDILTRDSNNSGFPDWEQTLYGLDPTADGATNRKIIEEKQAAANIPVTGDTAPSTATDIFTQQLLSTILALDQSGSLTQNSLTQLAASVGDGIDAKHSNSNTYSLSDITPSIKDDASARQAYKIALQGVVSSYNDVPLGSELTIISSGLGDGGAGSLEQLQPIADAYTSLSKQIIKLTTPRSAEVNALALANATAEMGASLSQTVHFYDDVIAGMVGIDDYVKASAAEDTATQNLSAYFSK